MSHLPSLEATGQSILPPWAEDRRFLVSYLAYSGFLGRVRLGDVHKRYARLLHDAPPVKFA